MKKNRQHGSSVGKLLPASPSKRMSKIKLEGSTSNPSMSIAQRSNRRDQKKQLMANESYPLSPQAAYRKEIGLMAESVNLSGGG